MWAISCIISIFFSLFFVHSFDFGFIIFFFLGFSFGDEKRQPNHRKEKTEPEPHIQSIAAYIIRMNVVAVCLYRYIFRGA